MWYTHETNSAPVTIPSWLSLPTPDPTRCLRFESTWPLLSSLCSQQNLHKFTVSDPPETHQGLFPSFTGHLWKVWTKFAMSFGSFAPPRPRPPTRPPTRVPVIDLWPRMPSKTVSHYLARTILLLYSKLVICSCVTVSAAIVENLIDIIWPIRIPFISCNWIDILWSMEFPLGN